jgi:hypothetical protein
VVLREVLEQEPERVEVGRVREVGVVPDRGQAPAAVVQCERRLDELPLALERAALELDPDGVAQDLGRVRVGVHGPGDGGDLPTPEGTRAERFYGPIPNPYNGNGEAGAGSA